MNNNRVDEGLVESRVRTTHDSARERKEEVSSFLHTTQHNTTQYNTIQYNTNIISSVHLTSTVVAEVITIYYYIYPPPTTNFTTNTTTQALGLFFCHRYNNNSRLFFYHQHNTLTPTLLYKECHDNIWVITIGEQGIHLVVVEVAPLRHRCAAITITR